jgi:hypothetical protein
MIRERGCKAMADLYAFKVTVTGELNQIEAERLDDLLLGGNFTLAQAIRDAILDMVPAMYLPANQADFDVKVVAA